MEEALTQSLRREDGNNHVRAALEAIVERLGFPAQYGVAELARASGGSQRPTPYFWIKGGVACNSPST